VAATLKAFGDNIDILVNNAGVLLGRPITETTPEDYAKIFDVNVRAPLLMTKAVVPHLRAPGRIIMMSSVGSKIGPPQMALYAGSKAAIEGITRSLAQELGGAGHTVNAVAPGPTESEMLDDVPKDIVETQLKTTAVEHRVGTVDDVARIVAWLASEDARWVSGQTISASGGFCSKGFYLVIHRPIPYHYIIYLFVSKVVYTLLLFIEINLLLLLYLNILLSSNY